MTMDMINSQALVRNIVLASKTEKVPSGNFTHAGLNEEIARLKSYNAAQSTVIMNIFPPQRISAVQSIRSRIRKVWTGKTIPWEDRKWRAVLSSDWPEVQTKIRAMFRELESEWNALFILEYDELVKESRDLLQGIWGTLSFPSKEDLKGSFELDLKVGQISNPENCKLLNMSTEMRDQMMVAEKAQLSRSLTASIRSLSDEIVDTTRDLVERMNGENPEQCRFAPTLNRLKDMGKQLKAVNQVLGAKSIERSLKHLEDITAWSPEAMQSGLAATAINKASDRMATEMKEQELIVQ